MKLFDQLTRIKPENEEELIQNGYFKCNDCNTYAYNSELKMFFNLSNKGKIKISKDGNFQSNSARIVCSKCHDELNN